MSWALQNSSCLLHLDGLQRIAMHSNLVDFVLSDHLLVEQPKRV